MRKLTRYFGSYQISKYEKATGKSVMDILDIGNFEVTKIAEIIKLGNKDFTNEEDPYNRLDEYLKSEPDNSLITAYFDLITELDMDIKIMRTMGINMKDFKNEFMESIQDAKKKLEDDKDKLIKKELDNIQTETTKNDTSESTYDKESNVVDIKEVQNNIESGIEIS